MGDSGLHKYMKLVDETYLQMLPDAISMSKRLQHCDQLLLPTLTSDHGSLT
jgi:hypothetical protein